MLISAPLGIGQTPSAQLTSKFIEGEIPLEPAHALWQQAPPLTIKLMQQQIAPPWGGGAVSEIEVRALHNSQSITFWLRWSDATVNQELVANDAFSDGVALQFPADPTTTPTAFMGDAQNAVNIWQWQAAWQRDVDEGGIADVDRTHPAYGDVYVEQHMREKGEIFWRPGEFVNNWRAQRDRITPVENMVAMGYGTITHLEQQGVHGRGIWANGQWRVTLGRALHTHLPGEAEFKPGTKTQINVAVWEGSAQERGGRKSVSLQWYPLELQLATAGTATKTQPKEQEPTETTEPKETGTTPASSFPALPAVLAGIGGLIIGILIAVLLLS